MTFSFSLGKKQFWNGLAEMQTCGLYWVNVDSEESAYRLCGQVIDSQEEDTHASVLFPQHNLLCTRDETRLAPDDILLTRLQEKPPHVSYYQLAEGNKALLSLPVDITRLRSVSSSLTILLLPATYWQALNDKQLTRWMRGMSAMAENNSGTFLILCHGAGINGIKNQLHLYHRQIWGLAELKTHVEPNQWSVSWWHDSFNVQANTVYPLAVRQTGWEIQQQPASSMAENTGDDQWMLLAERTVLEGAPALSERWFLFDGNEALVERASQARAATVIFALSGNDEVDVMARQIHRLRMQRGNNLKIVIREMNSSLRYVDQRLLQACGANLVVPHAARLSNFLTLLDDLQNLSFTRHVDDNIEKLLDSRLPTHHKGYLPLPLFCNVMKDIWTHASLATESRGILISLRPAAGISPAQAISLCSLRRDGDILTVTDHHLYLFLSNCQVSDVESVLDFLFNLPVKEVFTSQTFWSQEQDIQSQIRRLASRPAADPPVISEEAYVVPKTEPLKRAQVHQPVPVTLAVSDTPLMQARES